VRFSLVDTGYDFFLRGGRLGEVGDVRSEGQISLEKTKWLALLSSTAARINFGLHVVLHGPGNPFTACPCLHPVGFGPNLDSVLNDVGMLLACGMIKNITCETVIARFSTAARV
jgi:hypothetical protein